MMNSIFEALLEVFSHPDARDHHGYDAAVALALLVNYRKHEVKWAGLIRQDRNGIKHTFYYYYYYYIQLQFALLLCTCILYHSDMLSTFLACVYC